MGGDSRNHAASPSEPAAASLDELPLELRQRIDSLHARMVHSTHYELFGLEFDADRKAIKRAYYELATLVHPDRHYKRKLGVYKQRLEELFARITEAHDVLTDVEARSRYDQSIVHTIRRSVERRATQPAQSATVVPAAVPSRSEAPPPSTAPRTISSAGMPRISPSSANVPSATSSGVAFSRTTSSAEVAAARHVPPPSSLERGSARTSDPLPPSAPASSGIRAGAPFSPHRRVPTPPPSSESLSEQARKAALAKRLAAGRITSPTPAVPLRAAGSTGTFRTQDDARATFRRMAEERRQRDSLDPDVLMARADAQIASGQPQAALDLLRQAASLSPNDPEIRRRLTAFESTERAGLAHQYRKTAEDEERNGRYDLAVKAWRQLVLVLPDDLDVAERAARAMLRGRAGDLHEAADLAKRVLARDASRLSAYILLADIYLAAGLAPAAKRVAMHAVGQGHTSAELSALLQKLR